MAFNGVSYVLAKRGLPIEDRILPLLVVLHDKGPTLWIPQRGLKPRQLELKQLHFPGPFHMYKYVP